METQPPTHDPLVQHAASATTTRLATVCRLVVTQGIIPLCLLVIVASTPTAAQSAGAAFCDTPLAQTMQNLFTLIQFGGPLIGGVTGLAAAVALPYVRRSDRKNELKNIMRQAVIYGIIVAPLATSIVAFLLNNVVAGGQSCGF